MRLGFSFMNREEDQVIPSAANTFGTSDITDRRLRAQQFALNFSWAPPDVAWLDMRAQLYRNTVGVNERRIIPLDNRRDVTDLETWGLSVQNTARFSLFGAERHALTLGFDGYRDTQEGRRNGVARAQYPDASQDVIGFYVQDEITLGAATLTAGLRFDRFDQSATGQRGVVSERLSPRISFAYRVTDWMQPYISYAEAYRAPGLSQLYNSGVHFPISFFLRPTFNVFVPNPNLRPETSRNLEAGVNFRFRDALMAGDSLRIRGSAFQNNLDDFIETIVTATTTEQRNVTRARIQGLELEGQYESGPWFAGLGASILRGEDRANGGPLALIPAHKLSVSLGRRFQEQGVTLGGRVQLVAEQGRKRVDPSTGIRPQPTPAYWRSWTACRPPRACCSWMNPPPRWTCRTSTPSWRWPRRGRGRGPRWWRCCTT